MADYTAKLGLKKPAETDYVDIADINGNMDTLDEAFARYAVCSTAAATAAKTVTIPGFRLFAGAVAYIKFSVKNTAANPTLNISGTGAKAIWYQGAAISSSYLNANRTYAFIYDGSVYQLIGDINTDTKYSVFTGATTSAAGKTGLVPAPAAGYNNRFLRGDGAWSTYGSIYFHGQKEIPESADLNDYTDSGWYFCRGSATAATLDNCPTTNAFGLIVIKHNGVNQIVITYPASNSIRLYTRNSYQGDWSSWYRIFTQADMPLSSTSSAGFLRALSGSTTQFLRGDGTWAEAGGMDLDALASNTDPMEIQGVGANNATGLTLRQKNASYDSMIQTLEMKSVNGPPGLVFRTYLKQGSDPTGTEGTDYGGLEVWLNWSSKYGYLRPILDDVYSLGYSGKRWSTVYASNGTIQTSDRRRKSDIRLVPQKDQTAEETPALTQEDLLDFVRNVDIYTYVSDPEHTKTVQDAMAANEYEKIHIGIMANDLTGSKIFPFIGHKDGADENAPVGMKYESLGVVALYAIRALYDRIDKLEKRIEELEASGK